jgi:hypothetical protein|tara:strand:- start:3045 stop:4442 length:1398 start_codon:yes stop_codon:yes gene_type:complete
MKLNSIEEIKSTSVERFVAKYKLKHKEYGHKFSLKYDQLNTQKKPASNECRGIVISKDLEILSLPLIRFSNYNDNSRKEIDWDTATFWEKVDGTMIQYYYDFIVNKWCVGTTGTAEAVDKVTNRDKVRKTENRYDFDLSQLFHTVCEENKIDLSLCQKGNTYVFELTTECNVVVNHYKTREVFLLAIRNLETLKESTQEELREFAWRLNCERPKEFFFNTEEDMMASLRNVKHGDSNFEGYVVIDENHNRVKVKSNSYIIFSQFNGDIESKWRLVDIVINNEIEEVAAYFPELLGQMRHIERNYKKLITPIKEKFKFLKENIDTLEKKEFFIEAQKAVNFDKKKKVLLSILSQLQKNSKIEFDSAVEKIDKRKLFKLLNTPSEVTCLKGGESFSLEISATRGFDKSTFIGWYIREEDLDENGVLTRYYCHHSDDYNSGILADFDILECRIIVNNELSRDLYSVRL